VVLLVLYALPAVDGPDDDYAAGHGALEIQVAA
jgi:hypothetical protein